MSLAAQGFSRGPFPLCDAWRRYKQRDVSLTGEAAKQGLAKPLDPHGIHAKSLSRVRPYGL